MSRSHTEIHIILSETTPCALKTSSLLSMILGQFTSLLLSNVNWSMAGMRYKATCFHFNKRQCFVHGTFYTFFVYCLHFGTMSVTNRFEWCSTSAENLIPKVVPLSNEIIMPTSATHIQIFRNCKGLDTVARERASEVCRAL